MAGMERRTKTMCSASTSKKKKVWERKSCLGVSGLWMCTMMMLEESTPSKNFAMLVMVLRRLTIISGDFLKLIPSKVSRRTRTQKKWKTKKMRSLKSPIEYSSSSSNLKGFGRAEKIGLVGVFEFNQGSVIS